MACTRFHSTTVAGTSLAEAATTSGLNVAASKRPATRVPKTEEMEAPEGRGTLKQAKWRFSRFGMSFLPPPGVFMAAM